MHLLHEDNVTIHTRILQNNSLLSIPNQVRSITEPSHTGRFSMPSFSVLGIALRSSTHVKIKDSEVVP